MENWNGNSLSLHVLAKKAFLERILFQCLQKREMCLIDRDNLLTFSLNTLSTLQHMVQFIL